MPKKRKPRRPAGDRASASPPGVQRTGGASPERRERKEQARQAREAARKRAQRTARIRRAATFAVIAVVGLLIIQLFQRAAGTRPIPQAAIEAAKAGGCTDVQTPASSAPGGQHLAPGASYTYDQHPATSGFHDPSPLDIPPRVYPVPIAETRAVHNLEHGGVIIYYRSSGAGALSQAKIDRMTTIANAAHNTILAPYEQLPEGTALAFAAWNKLQTCPTTVTGPQAREIALGFIQAFVCTSNAPEGNLGEGC
jgi:hypothetical protein